MRKIAWLVCGLMIFTVMGCFEEHQSSDVRQREQQERILQEGTSQVGMPAIKNFRERKLLKDIFEMRDQEGLVTYTYVQNNYTGKFRFLGESIGYGIPYSTQFTNPQKVIWLGTSGSGHYGTLPQADPNGLFAPSSAEGTWVLLRDSKSGDVSPVYVEPKVLVSTFKLPDRLVEKD